MAYVIGVTGGIGSGKTLVSDRFSEFDVPIIDTDIIARKIVEPGQPGLEKLTDQFGSSILLDDSTLNRSALREIAFSSESNKQALDDITHPIIRQETYSQIEMVSTPYCLVVVPLLKADSAFIKFMHRVLVVTAKRDVKIERVKKRSQLSKEQILKIMNTQLDDSERLSFADDVINNDNSIKSAYQQVDSLHAQYLDLAATHKQLANL